MPWTETAPMKERMRFVTDQERGLYSMMEHPALEMPAPSTAGDLLARRGLVKKRRRRRRYTHPGVVPPTTERPNDLWTADFKGHFRTRGGIYCYPLTAAPPGVPAPAQRRAYTGFRAL